MANTRKAVVTFAVQGMNGSIHPAIPQVTGLSRMTNCQIKGQMITTRPGFMARVLGPDADEFRGENIQGAIHYNPVYGQSQQSYGENRDAIIISAGGKKFHLTFGRSDIPSISNETAGIDGLRDAMVVWMFQAENYAIAQDGASNIWIWDGQSQAFTSPGYNVDKPERSRLANAASVGAYVHGRIVQVIMGGRIIVGDIIHKTRLSDPVNILGMTEQIYYATGSYFSPPSNMGEVVAMGILPLSNTLHGHDDLVIHCRRGIFSLKLDHSPRVEWPAAAISKHLLLDTAATGPYALVLYDGDQMFRSRDGIQSIRSAAANANILGNPNQPISEPVSDWLEGDHHSHLKFASLAKWARQHRILCTTGLWARGRFRGGRGIVSLNMNPDGSATPEARAWEGLWTLPEDMGLPVQIINAKFNENDRLFVLSTLPNECDQTYKNSLVECKRNLKYDILEDGTISRISSQAILSQFPLENIFNEKFFRDGRVNFVHVEGKLDWGVWGRNSEDDPWLLWKTGVFDAPDMCDTASELLAPKSYRFSAELGDAPNAISKGKTIQLLVRWRGYAAIESVVIGFEEDTSNSKPTINSDKVVETAPCGDYDDYEYTSKKNRWEEVK